MIKRDQYGIIVQHSKLDPNYGDGGDSAMRTGIMALCGSDEDTVELPYFEVTGEDGMFTRHPYQPPWNNPNNFTRDQLVCLMAGLKSRGRIPIAYRGFIACMKRGFRAQNTEYDAPGTKKAFPNGADLLSPSDVFYLAVCADAFIVWRLLLGVFGVPWFCLDLIFATLVKPWDEQNQIICKCLIFGKWTTRLYVWLHPNYKESLTDYWCGWRDQIEIRDAIITKVEETVK